MTSYCFFMFMAGLDTVAAAFGYALYHFATHPADRQRIVADPALIPAAIEEILRVYAFTIPARKVRKDIEVAGPIAAGSMVQLPIRAARGIRARSRAGRRSGSTARPTTTSRWPARTGAWAPTWPATSWSSRWRSGTSASPTTGWPTAR